MERSSFIKTLLASPLMYTALKVQALETLTAQFGKSEQMPVLFIGHGHPMNALFDNSYTQALQKSAQNIPRPNAIMVISAHWETRGTFVSVNPAPKAIYDFGGFDRRLFDIKYEPIGAPELATETINLLKKASPDPKMGLDHGAWTILKFLYPNADIPVFQLSIDYTQPAEKHYEIATQLKKLRNKGVLIIGSGNIVHNLGRLDWEHINAPTEAWAEEFDQIVMQKLNSGDHKALINYKQLGSSALMSVPTEDHYLPMIYALGLTNSKEPLTYLHESFQYANISMRCFKIG